MKITIRLLTYLVPACLALLAIFFLAAATNAQTGPPASAPAWQEMINLSQSGGTSQPRFVVDSDGSGHLLWRDQFQGFVYSRSDNLLQNRTAAWTTPAVLELPFGTRRFFPDLQPTAATPRFNPHLLADNNGRIHAFWLDNEDRLYYSSVAAAELTSFNAWSARQQLAAAARALAVTLEPDGHIHLAYVRPLAAADFPAGVYHRRLPAGTTAWSDAALLYESPYLRGIDPAEAHVQVAAAGRDGSSHVYVGWDNPQRAQLFMTRSLDGGLNWETARQVDSRRPGDGTQATAPGRLLLQAANDDVLLSWQAGHEGRTCDQYYQWSADGGASWSEARPLSEQLSGCATAARLLPGPDGLALLLARLEGQGSLLLAWDGERWSDPQGQSALDTFTDPETFRPIDFACHQPVIAGGHLLLAGCDQGAGQDIWLTARPLGNLANWFPPPPPEPAWRAPVTLAEVAGDLAGLALTADEEGHFHAVWVGTGETALAYARWDGSQWSRPTPVLSSPVGGHLGRPALATTPNRLLAVWPDEESGELFFSWANSARATAASEWIEPRQLPSPRPLLDGVALMVDQSQAIYVAYTIPFNEERGVYLTWSGDDGQNWSAPLNVFDGVAAGWTRVGPPQLTMAANGRLYASWSGFDAAGRRQGFYYSYSDDEGLSWQEESAVVTAAVSWQQMVAVGEQELHQLWTGSGDTAATTGQPALWHRYSLDGGQSWSRPARVAGLGSNPVGPARAVLDPVGRLHLVQVATADATADGDLQLYQWRWQAERWQAEPPLTVGEGPAAGPAAAAAGGQQLGFAYLVPAAGDLPSRLHFSERRLEQPDVTPTPLPTLPPTATPTPMPTATPLPVPTPTLDFPTEAEPAPRLNLSLPDDRLARPLLGALPAVLLVILALIAGLYSRRR